VVAASWLFTEEEWTPSTIYTINYSGTFLTSTVTSRRFWKVLGFGKCVEVLHNMLDT